MPIWDCTVTAGTAAKQNNPWCILHCLLRQKDASNKYSRSLFIWTLVTWISQLSELAPWVLKFWRLITDFQSCMSAAQPGWCSWLPGTPGQLGSWGLAWCLLGLLKCTITTVVTTLYKSVSSCALNFVTYPNYYWGLLEHFHWLHWIWINGGLYCNFDVLCSLQILLTCTKM